jgi:hypothetical protein
MVSSARQLSVIVLNICTISGTLVLMFKAQRQVRSSRSDMSQQPQTPH